MLIKDWWPELNLGLEVGEIVEYVWDKTIISWIPFEQDDVLAIVIKEFKDWVRVYRDVELVETIQPKDMELKYSSIAESWTLVFKE